MPLEDVKRTLGVERFVWIDDMFGQERPELANLVMRHAEVAAAFPELGGLLAAREYRDVADDVAQAIGDLPDGRREEIGQALLQADARPDPADELPLNALEAACDALGVAKEDRLTFDEGERFIAGEEAVADVAIIIDLKDAGGSAQRGLDVLERCRQAGFRGIAFIMTHDATVATEAEQEAILGGGMAADGLPVTVIAKDRLKAGGDVEAAMTVALKRAGLRQVLRPLLASTGDLIGDTYARVSQRLLALEPERLQKYVYGAGAVEGESELHVVERALSAGLSQAVRRFMATDQAAMETTRRLRELQDIQLDAEVDGPGATLTELRQAELWDDGDIVNACFRPLSNGDVFEMDTAEPGIAAADRLFVLLAQPCDVMLRPKGERVLEVGMLVPLVPAAAGHEPDPDNVDLADGDKSPELPFNVFGKLYRMRLREIAYVRLSVLDLATFREDGRVMVEEGQTEPAGLPRGSSAIFGAATAVTAATLAQAAPVGDPAPLADERLLLTMSAGKPWKQARMACHLAEMDVGGTTLRKRVTWRLRRRGRLRPPYSTFMLDRVLGLFGRRAFDKDYAV